MFFIRVNGGTLIYLLPARIQYLSLVNMALCDNSLLKHFTLGHYNPERNTPDITCELRNDNVFIPSLFNHATPTNDKIGTETKIYT